MIEDLEVGFSHGFRPENCMGKEFCPVLKANGQLPTANIDSFRGWLLDQPVTITDDGMDPPSGDTYIRARCILSNECKGWVQYVERRRIRKPRMDEGWDRYPDDLKPH